jgi:hypothetical protein
MARQAIRITKIVKSLKEKLVVIGVKRFNIRVDAWKSRVEDKYFVIIEKNIDGNDREIIKRYTLDSDGNILVEENK